jgi:hypothetical protein
MRSRTPSFATPRKASTSLQHLGKKDVDGRDEPGHDEKANHFQVVRKSLKMPGTFSVRL